MVWIGLILLSAATLGVYDVCKKHAVQANAVMPVLFWGTATGTGVVMAGLGATGRLAGAMQVGWETWELLALKAGLVATSWTCAYYAMRALPISIVAPIRGSQPVWTLVGALVLFGERPGGWQWAGIATTFVGYYLFSVVGKLEGIEFRRNHGIGLILLATVLGAASALYDKYLLQPRKLTPETVQVWFQINISLVLGIAWLVQRGAGLAKTEFVWRWSIPAVGLVLAISDYLYFSALHEPGVMVSIVSPIRRSNCVISFLVGGAMFHDRNRRAKGVALGMIVLGVLLLCLKGK
jgi:transporter family protein